MPNKVMRVFIDTEFTGFINRDLISIGAVAEDGQEFYGENAEFLKPWASQFVIDTVYPLLNLRNPAVAMRRLELSARLWSWIEELPCDEVIIMADYIGDMDLLVQLFDEDKHPKIKEFQNINLVIYQHCDTITPRVDGVTPYQVMVSKMTDAFKLNIEDYFSRTGEFPHHALSDARANKEAYHKLVLEFGVPF